METRKRIKESFEKTIETMRKKYLDPKHDFVFKKIFGEHQHLLMSFLNEVLPLGEGNKIEKLEYLSSEMAPETPTKKTSIVDVRCLDSKQRIFIVEMQMYWSNMFMGRVLFNSSKAYVRQLGRAVHYDFLNPVYSLGIINDIFDKETDEFYHHYQIVNRENTNDVIRGLEYVMVELPKFQPQKWNHKKMAVLWLRFLKEVNDATREVADDLRENPIITEALDICEESAFDDDELEFYDYYWDQIRTEKSLVSASLKEGMEKGLEIGIEQGMQQGIERGMQQGVQQGIEQGMQQGVRHAKMEFVKNSLENGLSIDQVIKITGIERKEIEEFI